MRKKIFFLYPYYYPHYRAGGPVQSLYNLAGCLNRDSELYFVSLASDIDGSLAEPSIKLNSWQKGPQDENIFYTSSISFFILLRLIREVRPDTIFVNGLFNASTTLPGIVIARLRKIRFVISPRGMLQPWALQQQKTTLKRIFIAMVKMISGNKAIWHATDALEKNDIQKNFGQDQQVFVAANVPRQVIDTHLIAFPSEKHKIKLVFLSLINPNKNLHMIIDQVKRWPGKFAFDIYGPIRNTEYWSKCEHEVRGVVDIEYKGEVPSWKVQHVLQQYHFFVLPTEGENFGHAIFDALSCGVPVIISRNTPWQKIEEDGAGYYVDINKPSSLGGVLDSLLKLSADDYQLLSKNSNRYARNYYESRAFRQEYRFLFS